MINPRLAEIQDEDYLDSFRERLDREALAAPKLSWQEYREDYAARYPNGRENWDGTIEMLRRVSR